MGYIYLAFHPQFYTTEICFGTQKKSSLNSGEKSAKKNIRSIEMSMYKTPFIVNSFGWPEKRDFLGTGRVRGSTVTHAITKYYDPLCGVWISTYFSKNVDGKMHEVTCQHCLRIMNRHRIEPDWEI
jgi:hypothetical protein